MSYGTVALDTLQSSTAGTPTQFNDGNGTQVGTLCRAWVNYNGTTTTLRASFNVSSVTRNGAGDYTVNFTNAFADANYSVASVGNGVTGTYFRNVQVLGVPTTSAVRLITDGLTGFYDVNYLYVSIFR